MENKNLPIAIVTAALIIGVAAVLSASIYVKGQKAGGPAAIAQPLTVTPTPIKNIPTEGDAVLGDAGALITMIEFSDFQCPFCARYALETFPQLKKDYVDTGKVKVVFKHFPLPFHQDAKKAAEAAECAKKQEKFWEYKEKLFQNQQKLTIENLKAFAGSLGLKTTDFNTCLDSGEFSKKVEADIEEGTKVGVEGTPSFFIDGELLVGAQPYSEFQKLIEEKLKK